MSVSATFCTTLGGHEVADIGEVEAEHGDQDEHAAEQRVQEELDGGVFAARPAPDADEEVHRQQHHFPEDVEEEEIQGQEGADHAGFQEQEQHAIAADIFLDVPAGDHGQEGEDRGQQDERHADAVDAEVVVDVEAADPGQARDPIAGLVRLGSQFIDERLGRPAAPSESEAIVAGEAVRLPAVGHVVIVDENEELSTRVTAVPSSAHQRIHSSLPRGKIQRTHNGKAATAGTKMTRVIRSRSFSIDMSRSTHKSTQAHGWQARRSAGGWPCR